MAGLTREGFIPKTLTQITTSIESRLNQLNPGFDFSPESPDGQLIGIMSNELMLAWNELGNVYHSYNPNTATGQALRNLAQISGVGYEVSTRSTAELSVLGTEDFIVPKGSIVTDADGNEFFTSLDAVIPSVVTVVSTVPGEVPVPAGTLINIESVVPGWTGISQLEDGVQGKPPETEEQYRNSRNRGVMRNSVSLQESISSRLHDIGIDQVSVLHNDGTGGNLPDGTPPRFIHVVVGELAGDILDEDIAKVIFNTKGIGVQTHGTTTVEVSDTYGHTHSISFTKATAVNIGISIALIFLDEDNAGDEVRIKEALVNEVNSYLTGEDVIWSRLFGIITPFGKAQVDSITLSKDGGPALSENIVIGTSEFAYTSVDLINIINSTGG